MLRLPVARHRVGIGKYEYAVIAVDDAVAAPGIARQPRVAERMDVARYDPVPDLEFRRDIGIDPRVARVTQVIADLIVCQRRVARFSLRMPARQLFACDDGEVFIFPPAWIPDPVRWQNYADAVTAIPFFTYLGNTVFVTAMSIIGTATGRLLS